MPTSTIAVMIIFLISSSRSWKLNGPVEILVGWYDASDPAFARLHVFDASGKDVGIL
ncbi:MAG: hypothetical protein HY741_24825 [Chloroflexi bacterium]|nr:hypothetical protein [Chloroflexota bacterium]